MNLSFTLSDIEKIEYHMTKNLLF